MIFGFSFGGCLPGFLFVTVAVFSGIIMTAAATDWSCSGILLRYVGYVAA
jgi:hypothetical protein